MTLEERWTSAWDLLGLPRPSPGLLDDLLARYAEPHRAYHTLEHLEECFARYDEAAGLAERPGELLLAIWLHDVVYRPRRSDNEAKSAAWAEEILRQAGAKPDVVRRVGDLIRATAHLGEAPDLSADSQLLLDVDLAILGADPERFAEYEAQIRREYRWVPGPIFRRERRKVLEGFLARPTIFGTAHFRERLEARARENLKGALARL